MRGRPIFIEEPQLSVTTAAGTGYIYFNPRRCLQMALEVGNAAGQTVEVQRKGPLGWTTPQTVNGPRTDTTFTVDLVDLPWPQTDDALVQADRSNLPGRIKVTGTGTVTLDVTGVEYG